MLAGVRRKLAMGKRVWDFFQAHPGSEAGHLEVLRQLEERLARTDALALQQQFGLRGEGAAVDRRSELRRKMQLELLPHLVRVGQVAGKERPDLAGRFRLPTINSPLRLYFDVTKGMLALAEANRELFVAKGLAGSLLDDLRAAVTEFEKATEDAHAGRRDHVGATADLREVAREIVSLVGQLDGLNRYRFRADPELKAAWRSARDVVGPFTPTEVKPEGKGGEVLPGGEIASAA